MTKNVLNFTRFADFQVIEERKSNIGRLMSKIKGNRFVIIISCEKGLEYFKDKNPNLSIQKVIELKNKTNFRNTNAFREHLKGIGIQYIGINGEYSETVDGENIPMSERSTIVFGHNDLGFKDVIDFCINIAIKTHQDSILFATNGEGMLYFTNDCTFENQQKKRGDVEYLGTFHATDIGNAYTTLKKALADNGNIVKSITFNNTAKVDKHIQDFFHNKNTRTLYEDNYLD